MLLATCYKTFRRLKRSPRVQNRPFSSDVIYSCHYCSSVDRFWKSHLLESYSSRMVAHVYNPRRWGRRTIIFKANLQCIVGPCLKKNEKIKQTNKKNIVVGNNKKGFSIPRCAGTGGPHETSGSFSSWSVLWPRAPEMSVVGHCHTSPVQRLPISWSAVTNL